MSTPIGKVEVLRVDRSSDETYSLDVQGRDVVHLETGVTLETEDGTSRWELTVIPYVCGGMDPGWFVDRLIFEARCLEGASQLVQGMTLVAKREGGRRPLPVLGTCEFTAGKHSFTGRLTREECERLKGTWSGDG